MTQPPNPPRRRPAAPAWLAPVVLASLLGPTTASAAPQTKTNSASRATVARRDAGAARQVHQRVPRDRGRRGTKHTLLAAFVADAPLYGTPATVGLAAEYQYRLSPTWRLAAGGELRLGDSPTVLQPHLGAEATLARVSQISIFAGAGLAVPFWFAPTYTAAAVAMRGVVGARWHWPLGTRVIPFAATTIMVGPVLTPEHIHRDIHASLQLLVGMRIGIL